MTRIINRRSGSSSEAGYQSDENQELIVHGNIIIDKYKDRYIAIWMENTIQPS